MKTLSLIACICFAAAVGCSNKDGDKPKPDDKTETTPATKEGAAKAAPAGEEAIICCEFNGATGTSTASMCEKGGGKVVADLEPPCT